MLAAVRAEGPREHSQQPSRRAGSVVTLLAARFAPTGLSGEALPTTGSYLEGEHQVVVGRPAVSRPAPFTAVVPPVAAFRRAVACIRENEEFIEYQFIYRMLRAIRLPPPTHVRRSVRPLYQAMPCGQVSPAPHAMRAAAYRRSVGGVRGSSRRKPSTAVNGTAIPRRGGATPRPNCHHESVTQR